MTSETELTRYVAVLDAAELTDGDERAWAWSERLDDAVRRTSGVDELEGRLRERDGRLNWYAPAFALAGVGVPLESEDETLAAISESALVTELWPERFGPTGRRFVEDTSRVLVDTWTPERERADEAFARALEAARSEEGQGQAEAREEVREGREPAESEDGTGGADAPDDRREWTVAVVDSGIDVRNPFVAGAVRTRHDYAGGGEWDATGHGTLIALQFVDLDRNTRRHAPGATPTRLVDMKVADAVGFSEGNLICALNDALVEGVDLVNLSLGLRTHGEREPCPLCTAVNRLAEFGVFVCVAAGNRPADAPQYTAYCPCIAEGSICTGAVEPDGTLAPFTELGEVYTDGRIGVYDVTDFWEIEFSPGISGSFVPRDAVEYVRRLANDAAEPHVLLIELYPGETLAFTPEGFLEYVDESLSAMERPDYGLLPNPGKITPVPVA